MCMQGFIKGRCGMCVYAGFHKGEVGNWPKYSINYREINSEAKSWANPHFTDTQIVPPPPPPKPKIMYVCACVMCTCVCVHVPCVCVCVCGVCVFVSLL